MAVPGPVTSAMSVGSHEELRTEGTTLVTEVAHIIEVVGRIGADLAPVPRAEETPLDRLSPLQRQVLDGVRPRKILTAEQIAAVVGVSTRDARRTLPGLESAAFVTAVDGGYRLWRKSDDRARTGAGHALGRQGGTAMRRLTDMASRTRSSRWNPTPVGQVLVTLGVVFLVYLLGLLALFRFTSDPVAAGQTYRWDSTDAMFVQPVTGDVQCVVHTSGSAARVTVHRTDSSLIPGELVDRPDAEDVSLTCDQPARVAAGVAGQLYPATGPAKGVVLFGVLAVVGAGLWLVGRFTAASRPTLTGGGSGDPEGGVPSRSPHGTARRVRPYEPAAATTSGSSVHPAARASPG